VDAEHFGDDRGGNLAREMQQGAAACAGAVDADELEAAAERELTDGTAGRLAAKEPAGFVDRGGGARAAVSDEVAEMTGERFWQLDRCRAEADRDGVLGDRDVVDGEASDPTDGLGEQDDEQRGDAVADGNVGRVQ
jgi:hypothetical protein